MPPRLTFRLLLALLLVTATTNITAACSVVLINHHNHPIVARNYDWHLGHALVMVNQRGMAKRALSFDNPATWQSRYGSVTLNQYGRELPCEGINERGLAITILWLPESEYPASDGRPSLTTAQWLQYQLDTAATVDEVIASDPKIRITPFGGAKVHYFVADATGNCAAIEFLAGQMVVHRHSEMAIPVLTNETYAQSATQLASYIGFGGQEPIPTGLTSPERFVRLGSLLQHLAPAEETSCTTALTTVDAVARPDRTRWQTVYDLERRQLYFRTGDHPPVRHLSLPQLDFANNRPVQVLDIEAKLSGEVTPQLRDYQLADNRRLVQRSFHASTFANFPASILELVVHYPEQACRPLATPAKSGSP